ncbi:hypothetical protein B0T25DRAFT_130115 [Lasiosphaeria hispida]|uniref:Rhodopsin domain-containing protein n=1 Tax=Lasiosphaeria hispida TaxID=260671 RepID=A0AAJ0MIM5_9PEZI|nr:hypothetical protein B0T25DRAFT_130115 [Lasiosphaeria hispida]
MVLNIAPLAMPAVVADCIFTSLAFIVVCMRLGTRLFLVKNFGVDDAFMALSMLASIGFLIIIMLQIKVGLGRQLTFPEVPGFLQALWATIPVYNLALILCKLSITVQCYRVLRTPKMQRFFRTYFVFLVVYGLWTFFSSIMTCWPVEAYWLAVTGMQGVCLNKGVLTFSNAGINIATDLILIVVPVPLLWRLQIPKKQKIILMGLFCVGALAVVTSIIRLQSLYMIAIAPQAEQSVMGVSIAIWSCIEINTAIICASIPAIKPLVVKAFPKMLLSSLYARTKGAAAYYASTRSAGKEDTRVHESSSGSKAHGGSALRSSTRTAIQVEQSFEMRSVPVLVGGGEDEIKSLSRDGSEKDLVASSWQDEYHAGRKGQKKVTITSLPRDMV